MCGQCGYEKTEPTTESKYGEMKREAWTTTVGRRTRGSFQITLCTVDRDDGVEIDVGLSIEGHVKESEIRCERVGSYRR